MPDKIYALNFTPGIQRDGTSFTGRGWIDGRWTRFQRGLPRKIGGYIEIAKTDEIVRGIFVVPVPPNFIIIYGTASKLFALRINADGVPTGLPVDRTPVDFNPSNFYDWQFDTIYSAVDGTTVLVAQAARNLFSIASMVESPIYYGPLLANTPLVSNGESVSGGISVFYPFLFSFGNNGKVSWYQPNSVTDISNDAFVSGEKIVSGLPSRGGSRAPAGLLWSLTSVIRVTYTGNPDDEFDFDAVASESSILSSRGIIEYDNQYYWAAVDRFLVYNGTVQELPNHSSVNYFFDNLNYAQRQKVWATKVTRFGEIWWHYPTRNSTECNRALIYNVRERTWYDTDFDTTDFDGRSDGYFDQVFAKPIWSGSQLDSDLDYPLYIHEVGTDRVLLNGDVEPIDAFIKTPGLSNVASALNNSRPETDIGLYISRIEPDFTMSGSMDVTITAKQFAQSDEQIIGTDTFDSTTEFMNFTAEGREIYIKFSCDGVGCDYEMGQVLVVGKLGDVRA